MTITILGAGYVGLTSAAVFAELGNTVYAVRKDNDKIEDLKRGKAPFFEPEIEEIIARNVKQGRLIPTIDYSLSVPKSDIVFICVGTPTGKNGEADLSQVFAAAEELARHLKNGYTVIVDKSTVPIGTADKVTERIRRSAKLGAEFDVVSCPEFLRQGSAVWDTLNPDRIIIGSSSKRASNLLLELHASLPGERMVTDVKTAEMIKYASNAFLATKISFINEIANICESVGADIEDVARGMGLDSRIGKKFLKAGIGWSGSCFPKDVRALNAIALLKHYEPKLLKATIEVNNNQRIRIIQRVEEIIGGLAGKEITLLGLAFKPGTDDTRESVALDLLVALKKKGARVRLHDPVARPDDRSVFHDVLFFEDPYEALRGADTALIATEWPEFLELDWDRIRVSMRRPVLADGRNMLDPKRMRAAGWTYFCIGRP